jgi:hypothetical protein
MLFTAVTGGLAALLEAKRAEVEWKHSSVRKAFDDQGAPRLPARRPDAQAQPS